MTRTSSRLLAVFVLLLALASAGRALAQANPSGPSQSATADSASAPRRVEIQQLLTEADSVVRAQGGSRGDMARIYLTWDAPYGHRRARGARQTRCVADSTVGDTLYLSCLPGRPSRGFNAFTADLRIHPAAGDSLPDWWHLERGGANAGSVVVQFGPDPSILGRQPWGGMGRGAALLQNRAGETQLKLVYAVPYDQARPIRADSVYTLARVVFKHRRVLAGCERPACIEWASGTLAYGLKDEPQVTTGERYVAWNSPDGSVCAPFRARATLRPWSPGAR